MSNFSNLDYFSLVAALLFTALPIHTANADGNPPLMQFNSQSLETIEQRFGSERLLVSLWSIDCPPCLKEIALLSRLLGDGASYQLVLINTDGPGARAEAESTLAQFDLPGSSLWIFGEEPAERLRFSIDPDWRGEMPRSYLYSTTARVAYSGLLQESVIRDWLDQ
ncbi:MAG: hypothetical protein AAGF35_14260 [Pseudomonadota bacterium]